MESAACVSILLATYNGDRYVDEQIRSLLAQTYSDFVVIARDDHSSDRTPEILARYAASQPKKIRVVSDDRGNLGALGNFSRLMEICDSPYFAFCDQDDVWLPNKIELMINELRCLENQVTATTPILIYSDLRVVDETLREISPSFLHHWQTNRRHSRRLDHLIFHNIATGCATMANRALLELARPIPDGLPYHDWWLALLAASCGVLRAIPETTILYRQHGENLAGAGPWRGRSSLWNARYILQQPRKLQARMAKAMAAAQSRANILLRVAEDKMSQRDREFLRAFCLPRNWDEVSGLPWARRKWLFARSLVVYARALPLALPWCC
jgi:glycosyltransferase involved in cell wall biosynthesis